MSGPRTAIGAGRIKLGSVAAVVAEYFNSQQFFGSKSAGTQRMRRGILERFRAAYGDRPFALLPAGMDRGAARRQAAACRPPLARDLALALPVCGQARMAARGPDAQHQAARDQRRRIPHLDRRRDRAIRGASSDRHQAASRAGAVALHRATAKRCRPHGPPAHPRTACSDGKQQKTGVTLAIPVHPHLRTVLDATPSEHLTFLVTATGKPYGGNAFSEQFRKLVRRRRIAEACKPHGLRKAACRRLAEAGCSRKRDHGDQRPRDDERVRPLHQSGGSGAARPQCDGADDKTWTRSGWVRTSQPLLMQEVPI